VAAWCLHGERTRGAAAKGAPESKANIARRWVALAPVPGGTLHQEVGSAPLGTGCIRAALFEAVEGRRRWEGIRAGEEARLLALPIPIDLGGGGMGPVIRS